MTMQSENPFFMKDLKITIRGETMTLGQLLKLTRVIVNGGEARAYLAANKVLVNDEREERRGRKLHPGDRVTLEGMLVELNGQR